MSALANSRCALSGADQHVQCYVMGDERTYDYAIAMRAVTTTDFMTAEVTMLSPATITTAANRIVNEVKHILFDYTKKSQ